jgi:hypothetical protein
MRIRVKAPARLMTLVFAACGLLACQSPTDPDETLDVIEASGTPDPTSAAGPTGKTYTVTRSDDTTETREYDWKATFTVRVRLTEDANDSSITLELPVKLSSASIKVQQAAGGIVTPPTGSETERYEYVIVNASSNQLPAVNSTVDLTFDVWYDLPNQRRESLISVSLVFADKSGRQFSETVEVRVAS